MFLFPEQGYQWWALRAVTVHQQCLSEKSEALHSEALSLIEAVSSHRDWKDPVTDETPSQKRRVRSLWLLEAAHFHASYHEVGRARELASEAALAAGLRAELTGAMGRRTRFQDRDLPQLTVDVRLAGEESLVPDAEEALGRLGGDLPPDLKLDDEVRLEKIQFADGSKEGQVDYCFQRRICKNLQNVPIDHFSGCPTFPLPD